MNKYDPYTARLGRKGVNIIFRKIKVDFTYQLPVKENRPNDDDHLVMVKNTGWSDPVEVCEPLVPISAQTANQLANAQEGTATEYQYIWLSRHNVPMKTRITFRGQQLTITNKVDYTDLANFYEYYLKGRSDLNAK